MFIIYGVYNQSSILVAQEYVMRFPFQS